MPLFGLDWLLAFGVALPDGVTVHAVSRPAEALSTTVQQRLRKLLNEYADVFSSELGRIRCQEAVVNIDPDARPKAFAARPVPFPMREAVEAELKRLTSLGILEPVDPTTTPIEWASPIVITMKANGSVRICGDFKVTINPHIICDSHHLPTFDEIALKLNNCQVFNVIDLKDAYLQLPVAPESRKYLVISTTVGYFRYTRLPFGVNFAPGLFQSTINKVLAGVQSTSAFIDDVINGAVNDDQALELLRATLDVLRKFGLRASLPKCRFLAKSVTYLGHCIDAAGVHPSEERLRAIRDMSPPTNRKQLRSFLGAVNFYAKFIPQLQSRCAALHQLTREGTRWCWEAEHDAIFTELKAVLTSSDTLVHYDPDKPLVICSDASDVGVGAMLMNRFPDNTLRPIMFASRLLDEVERRYSAVDREGLGIIFAVKKFEQFILGRRFILKTDHKPLERIFCANVALPKVAANRLARWAMTLSNFNYQLEYQNAAANAPADMLSRFPVDAADVSSVAERMGHHSNLLHLKVQDVVASKRQLRQQSVSDPLLSQVMAYMERGWPDNSTSLPKELHTFFEKRTELSLEENLLLWRGRIVIPAALQPAMLQMLHESHPGVSAMRDLARFYVWWPHVDDDVEAHVAACSSCQAGRGQEPEVPLYSWNVPTEAWSRVHADFAGPYEGHMWLLVIDAYSKWLEVVKMKTTTSAATIAKLREIFARQGVVRTLVTDNGPQWTSEEFKRWCSSNFIHHITGNPYHPKTNGLAERAVRTFKTRMSAARRTTPDLHARLQKFLLTYRNTPQKSTGRAPSEMVLGRRLRTCLDLLRPDVRATMDAANFRQQRDHDRTATPRAFAAGDPVWVANNTGPGHQGGEVLRRTGPLSYVVLLNGNRVRKHADQLRFRRMADVRGVEQDDDAIGEVELPADQMVPEPEAVRSPPRAPAEAAPPLRRSSRVRHRPVRLYEQYCDK